MRRKRYSFQEHGVAGLAGQYRIPWSESTFTITVDADNQNRAPASWHAVAFVWRLITVIAF